MENKITCQDYSCSQTDNCPILKFGSGHCRNISKTVIYGEQNEAFFKIVEKCLSCPCLDNISTQTSPLKFLMEMVRHLLVIARQTATKDRDLENISLEMAMGLSEVFDALKKISSGDPSVRITETSDVELIVRLKQMVNETAVNLGEIVDMLHEFAMGLAEHFDVLHRVSSGDLSARVTGSSPVELLSSLKQMTNQMIQIVAHEIAERKKAQEDAQESGRQLSTLMGNLPGMVYRCNNNEKWTMLLVSDGCKHLTGYETQDLKHDAVISYGDLIHPDDRQKVLDTVQAALCQKKSFQMEYRIVDRNRQIKWVWEQGVGVYSDDGEVMAIEGYIIDITDKKQSEFERQILEQKLQQATKMEAIGTLAGGIAHDFNNLLMGILGNVTLSLMNIDTSHPLYDRLKNIEKHVQCGADLTRQLLGFARGGKIEVKTTNLNELIQNSLEMFSRTKKELSVSTMFQPDLWNVDVDRGQIHQVMLNLYVNAWQAMPGGGQLIVRTGNEVIDSHDARMVHLPSEYYVKITVADTGVGMDAQTCERIFEPFFTTREKGRGTGLGLASAYGIIKNHGGIIHGYSEKGIGTTFTIYLPASKKMAIQEKRPDDTQMAAFGAILLVDDERLILEVAQLMLEKLGFRVISASNGPDAIEIFKNQKDQITLIILDMIMPEMNGGDVFDRLKAIDQNVRVILASGYSLNGHASDIMTRGCRGFIQKPFSLEDLTRKIQDVLTNE